VFNSSFLSHNLAPLRAGARTAKRLCLGAAALGLLFLAGNVGVLAEPPATKPQEPEEGFIVKFRPGTPRDSALQQMTRAGGTFKRAIPKIEALVGSTTRGNLPALLEALKRNPQVEYAEPDYEYHGLLSPNDTHYSTAQYAPQIMEADLAWDVTRGSPGVLVAVVDSGVDFNHPDFSPNLWWTNPGEIANNGIDDDDNGYVDDVHGYDFVHSDGDPTDDEGHGTAMTGVIAATLNNSLGIAGLAPESEILVVKVINSGNGVEVSRLGEAIIYAADQGAQIINLSLGGEMYSSTVEYGVNYAWTAGAVVVAAAGNTWSNPFYPAAHENAIAVTGTTASDKWWTATNRGEAVDISAPAEEIFTTGWDSISGSGYRYGDGTSFSAAHVSGVAALVLACDPTQTNAELRAVLEGSADDLYPQTYPGWDQWTGHGRVNAYNALLMACGPFNTPPQVTITMPLNGSVFTQGQSISFAGAASDTEDGGISGLLTWQSSLSGPIGSGAAFSAVLGAGTHTITASVTDSGGLADSKSIQIAVRPLFEVPLSSSGTLDGWVLESGENTNVGGTLKSSDSTNIGLLAGDNASNYQYKSIVSFDTSGIPDNATLVSAKLRLQRGVVSGTNPFDTHGALWADIRNGGFNNNTALETADFQAPATAAQVTSLSKAANNNDWSEGDLNSAGLTAINKTGVTQLRLYFNLDDNNDKGIDYLSYYPGEYATAASRPQLVVRYIVNDPPTVAIAAPANGQNLLEGSIIQFSGSATDPENGNLSSAMTWTSNLSGQIGTGGSFSRTLPLGTHTITAAATDSDGATASASITLRIRTSLPEMAITNPADGASFVAGTTVNLTGWADDLEDGNLTSAMTWTSSRDGALGSGGNLSKLLTLGAHTITASVTDADNHTSTQSINLTVTPVLGTATLTSNGAHDGWVLESLETSNVGGSLSATATSTTGLLLGDDKSDKQYKSIVSFDTSSIPANAAMVSAKLRLQRAVLSGTSPFTTHGALWADIRSGGFNNNVALETADFQAPATAEKVASLSDATANGAWSEGDLNAAGLAAINRTGFTQLRVYFNLDDNDDVGIDYLGYYPGEYTAGRPQLVVNYQVNSLPTVSASTLPSGSQFPVGSLINFVGSAFDPEDGDRTSTLQWTSSLDGPIGTGGFASAVLSLGTHTITATATDSQGGAGSATLTLRVRTSQPAVDVTAPATGTTFTTSQTISFTAWADDLEQGDLTSAIVWTSNLSGQIGTGGAFSRTLPEGNHTLTATITDNQNNTSTDSITLTINVPPPQTLTFNSVGTYDGWVLESGETTNVGGSIKSNTTTSAGLLVGDDASDKQYKSILSFDTASLPDNATIETVTLRLMRGTVSGTSPFDTHGALWADIQTGGFNGNLALETADFQATATAPQAASLSIATANNTWSEGSLNAPGRAAVNKTGVTQVRVYFNLDDNDDAGIDYLGYYPGDYSTTTNRPQLVVTYRQ